MSVAKSNLAAVCTSWATLVKMQRGRVVKGAVLTLTFSMYALCFSRCLACARALRLRPGHSEFAVWPLIDDMEAVKRGSWELTHTIPKWLSCPISLLGDLPSRPCSLVSNWWVL